MLASNTTLQNRYRIIRQLGQGGMGTVYEAEALRLNTTVALKETRFTDKQLRKQFEREAQLLARLRHPALPRVIDHFDEGTGLYLVMDFITGEDLGEMIQRKGRAFPFNKVLDWADQLLDALTYLHNQQPPIIHRDIKPQNLKLTEAGHIILLDFGLAKGSAGQVAGGTTSESIMGFTPNYAPLEQIQGKGTDPRSDLYSLAATLYHLGTGVVPPDVLTRLSVTSDGQPDPLRPAHGINAEVLPSFGNILNRALAISRAQRFTTADEMRRALRGIGIPLQSERGVKSLALSTITEPSLADTLKSRSEHLGVTQTQSETVLSSSKSTRQNRKPGNLIYITAVVLAALIVGAVIMARRKSGLTEVTPTTVSKSPNSEMTTSAPSTSSSQDTSTPSSQDNRGYFVIAKSSPNRNEAQQESLRLNNDGFKTYVVEANEWTNLQQGWFIVVYGLYPEERAAKAMENEIKKRGETSVYVSKYTVKRK